MAPIERYNDRFKSTKSLKNYLSSKNVLVNLSNKKANKNVMTILVIGNYFEKDVYLKFYDCSAWGQCYKTLIELALVSIWPIKMVEFKSSTIYLWCIKELFESLRTNFFVQLGFSMKLTNLCPVQYWFTHFKGKVFIIDI